MRRPSFGTWIATAFVLALMAAALIPHVFSFPYQTLMPVFQKDVLGVGPEALGILRDAAKKWPSEPEAQNAFGTQLVRRGALDEAIDVFTGITTAKPADALGFFNLGRAYHLRYLRLQQNVAASRLRQPTALGDEDRKKAAAAYLRHIELKGQFEKEAREALSQLEWK